MYQYQYCYWGLWAFAEVAMANKAMQLFELRQVYHWHLSIIYHNAAAKLVEDDYDTLVEDKKL